jgi:hypothetical protein
MKSVVFDAQWKKMIRDMKQSVKSGPRYKKEFVDLLSVGLLNYVKDLSPVDSGELRDSWKIFEKTMDKIVIGTDNPEAYARVTVGVNARTIVAKSGKAMHFFIGGEEFFRSTVDIKASDANRFLQTLLTRAVDKAILDLSLSLQIKHAPITRMGKSAPKIKQVNLSKTVGMTGVKRNTRRGRGGGIQKAKTGRKSFKRTLSRRRRTGKFITRKKVTVE